MDLARDTPLAYSLPMITFIETAVFARTREQYLDDFEFAELQQFLIRHPDAGD